MTNDVRFSRIRVYQECLAVAEKYEQAWGFDRTKSYEQVFNANVLKVLAYGRYRERLAVADEIIRGKTNFELQAPLRRKAKA